jgi:hypothetical protein
LSTAATAGLILLIVHHTRTTFAAIALAGVG